MGDLRSLSDDSFETLTELSVELSDELSDELKESLSESTDECAKTLSRAATMKYARMFSREYRAVRLWAIRRSRATASLNRCRSRRSKYYAQRRADFAEAKLEKALAVFSAKVNAAKAAGK